MSYSDSSFIILKNFYSSSAAEQTVRPGSWGVGSGTQENKVKCGEGGHGKMKMIKDDIDDFI